MSRGFRHRLLVAGAAAISIAAASCHYLGGPAPKPDIIVVVVDTLRADRLGCYGDTIARTPFLDRMAARGLRFENAYATSSWTMPSVASLFTSRYPSQHNVNQLEVRLSDREVTLAERLRESGYLTAGFTANWRLRSTNGFAQGFDKWEPLFPNLEQSAKSRGETVRKFVVNWLNKLEEPAKRKPVFLYLQYLEPHAPLEPPADLREVFAGGDSEAEIKRVNDKSLVPSLGASKGLTDVEAQLLQRLYRAEVAAVDREIEAMFGELAKHGLLDHAVVVVTADHGEEFLEHGAHGHGYNLFNETARVPLIVTGPEVKVGVVVETFTLLDMAPTILELAGAAPEPRFEGRGRASWLEDGGPGRSSWTAGSPEAPTAMLELLRDSSATDLRSHQAGLVRGSHKYLVSPAGQGALFDLAKDPREVQPLPAAEDAPMKLALQHLTESFAPRRGDPVERTEVDPATLERLKALGYHQ